MELAGKTLAITGAGGFIGLRMITRARALGMKVRGLELSPAAAARARGAGAEVALGDICDPAAARRLCGGAEIVFHTAAIVGEGGDWALYRRVNVEGSRTVATAARDAGARRFVHLSSVMVYGFHFPPDVAEDGPLAGEDNAYCQTKIESETAVLALHAPERFGVTVIRPGDVYGPGSIPWVVRPLQLIKRHLFVLPDGGTGLINHVHVDNLLDGVLLALERDAVGRAFNVSDGVGTTCREYFGALARMLGRRGVRTLPSALLRPTFRLAERAARRLGREPLASASAIDFLLRPHAYSIARARRELGYAPRVTLAEGLRETEAWLRKEGRL